MAEYLRGLISDPDEIRRVYAARSKSVDEKNVSGAKKEALALKIAGEEADGWTVAKKNQKSVRMERPKPVDRQLEDDVWCLLRKMGFKEFNGDRNFTIKVGEASPPRQIDVFAKDQETIFIVECTHAEQNGAKSVKALVDKINGVREDVFKAIHSHFGKTPKLKVKWAIATRNVEWRIADTKRAAESGIAVLTETDLAYYSRLTDFLKEAARYQFLARFLKGEKVDGLRVKVPATRGKMGGVTFYNFLISPFDLLKISYISHKVTSSANDFETYQRMVKPSRLKSIAQYVDEGGQFPTNIVVNFKTKGGLHFEKMQGFDETTFGTLTLPGNYGAAWVVDGQHRLYGFSYSARAGDRHKQMIPVLAYENLPVDEEMKLFIDINSKQVRVSRRLLSEIYASLHHDSDIPAERLAALYARISIRLDEMTSSPIRDRILTVSKEKNPFRCLTLTSLADGIKENRFLGTPGEDSIQPGPLTDISGDLDVSCEKGADLLAAYFGFFANELPEHWQLGDAKGGFLCTNNGLRALLRLLRELIAYLEHRDHFRSMDLDAEAIATRVEPFLKPLADYFRSADPSEIQAFRSRQALDGVKQNCLGMMGIIHEALPEFSTRELKEYVGSRDKEGTEVAKRLIDEINRILFEDVTETLKAQFGVVKDAWWWKGIPQPTREKCDTQMNRDNGEKDRWQYLSLADYPGIVTSNWELFDIAYDFGDKGKKADKVKWISRLCKIRQTTHHPEKGLISKDEVVYVRQIRSMVDEKIVGRVHPALAGAI